MFLAVMKPEALLNTDSIKLFSWYFLKISVKPNIPTSQSHNKNQ